MQQTHLAWDPDLIFLCNQNKPFIFHNIGKYHNLQTLVLENSEIENLVGIHLCKHLHYLFLANNSMFYELNSIQLLSQIYILDLTNCPMIDLKTLSLINQTNILYLNLSNNNKFIQELSEQIPNCFDLINMPSYFDGQYMQLQLPEQGECPCHYIYDNRTQMDPMQSLNMFHVRLFFIHFLYKICALNYKVITPKEKSLAQIYYQLNQSVSDRVKWFISQSDHSSSRPYQHFIKMNYEQHYQYCKDFLQTLQTQQDKMMYCFYCKQLNIIDYMLNMKFATVDKLNFKVIFASFMYLVDLIRQFTMDKLEKDINKRFQTQQRRNQVYYLKYLPMISNITPYLLAELFTINHVILYQKAVNPKHFVNMANAILRNDMVRNYMLHLVIIDYDSKNSTYQKNFVQFVSQIGNLNKLYTDLYTQLNILKKCVNLAPGVKKMNFDQQFNQSVFLLIEQQFWKQDNLSLDSVTYFLKILTQKQKLLGERPDVNNDGMPLNEIDIFQDMYWFEGDAENDVLKNANKQKDVMALRNQEQTPQVEDDIFEDI